MTATLYTPRETFKLYPNEVGTVYAELAGLNTMPKTAPHPSSIEEIARRITLTRLAFSENQATFSRRTGISQQSLSNYEEAVRRISLDQALKLCAGTGVSLDWIYRGVTAYLPREIAENMQKIEGQQRDARLARSD